MEDDILDNSKMDVKNKIVSLNWSDRVMSHWRTVCDSDKHLKPNIPGNQEACNIFFTVLSMSVSS
jgi:hypothetical protein